MKTAAIAGAFATGGGLATPAISQGVAARTLRFVPFSDLANFDPIWAGDYVARNAALLVWDMLYGLDAQLKPRRQMIESEEVSADGLTWTFRLRPGLKFHDGEAVLAKDAVASIDRWAVREPMGRMIKAIENELVASDDRTFRWTLRKPYPRMLLALGKISPINCFIMPARIAATDPFKQVNEYVGSGPMRFVRNEWVPGAKAVFERFPGYVPREEPASWLAGGKRINSDRIEWIIIPDPSTAAAALQSGEADWWEYAHPDLVPVLQKNRNVVTDLHDSLGDIGVLSMNHLHAPFSDVRARRAILAAMSQEDYMHALTADDKMWKPMRGFFTPGTPLYTEEGGEILKAPRSFDAAKRLLAESGYAGERITCMAAQNLPAHKAFGDVTVDLLQRLGIKVDFAALDWGTVVARRGQKAPPGQGGWHMYPLIAAGADTIDPTTRLIRASGEVASNGWASSAEVEAEIADWFDAKTLGEEKAAAHRLNRAAFEHVVYAPLGTLLRHKAYRKNVSGIVPGPLPLFWGVSKTA